MRIELEPGQELRLVPSITLRPAEGIRVRVRQRTAASGEPHAAEHSPAAA
jgi:hypothetical protein